MGWPLGFFFIEQTASLVVAAVRSCKVTWFTVVASCRSMGITNIITICPAVVVVETILLFWRIAWWAILTVASKVSCKVLCLLTALDDFSLVPIEFGFIDRWARIALGFQIE